MGTTQDNRRTSTAPGNAAVALLCLDFRLVASSIGVCRVSLQFKHFLHIEDISLGSVRPFTIMDISIRDIDSFGNTGITCGHESLVSAQLGSENGTSLIVFARLEYFLMIN